MTITDLAISLVLTTFGEKAKEIQLCSPDQEAHTGWTPEYAMTYQTHDHY